MVLVQKWPFFQIFFLANIGQENVFYHILERKNAFLGYKNNKFDESKNWHFSKGLNLWFLVQKWPFFQHLCLGNIVQENVFDEILEQKTPFLAIKTRSSESGKIDIFPKWLTHGFWSKNGHFSNICF